MADDNQAASESDVRFQIHHFPRNGVWIVGPDSIFGINTVWKMNKDKSMLDQDPNKFDMAQYMHFRNRLLTQTSDVELPDPAEHVGARLVGYDGGIRTINQFCNVLLQLWRVRDDPLWKSEDKTFWYDPYGYGDGGVANHSATKEQLLFGSLTKGRKDDLALLHQIIQFEHTRSLTLEEVTTKSFLAYLCTPLMTALYKSFGLKVPLFDWEQPLDIRESHIIKAAVQWWIRVRALADDAICELVMEILESEDEVVYCDPSLPGHEVDYLRAVSDRGIISRTYGEDISDTDSTETIGPIENCGDGDVPGSDHPANDTSFKPFSYSEAFVNTKGRCKVGVFEELFDLREALKRLEL